MNSLNTLIEQLKADYARFPESQTYSLYAEDVQFKDPMNAFSGVEKYKKMIAFLDGFFSDIQMDLHSIEQTNSSLIELSWTLNMTAPTPWKPRLSILGRTELSVNQTGQISSHIDYWNCSRWTVLKQVFKIASSDA